MFQYIRFLLLISLFLWCFFLWGNIRWLFPYTGLAGLITPFVVLITAVISTALFFLLSGRLKNVVYTLLLFIVFFICQSYIVLSTYPQGYGGDVFSQMLSAKKAYDCYDSIQKDDFINLNRFKRVVYIYKFHDELPDENVLLSISKNGKSNYYLIEVYDNKMTYDKSKLGIIETDSTTIIEEYLTNGLVRSHIASEGCLRHHDGGSFKEQDFIISVSRDELSDNFDTGIEELLYDQLKSNLRKNDG
ncbi:hypothetical protein [Flammeovirga sp. SJP92]|uniref:hypothetical protein n=1 Tax=Flammeovirga sp. SJP92 TaxID=1775430 RepID=UPI0007881BC4|nr:hypothetical protein [Flammeovirga sp. SJP92]KXX69229.1 hypothetical protein AVL50_16330 [Flammeovirga sp. SJP92]